MTTERSLFTLFKICVPIALLPFFCLFLVPLSWNYLIYVVCIICIGCLTYWWEHTKSIVELGITVCFALSVLCFLTACWGIGCVFISVGTSSTETWQIIGALAAAGLTGTAAFATLGTLLHLIRERKDGQEERFRQSQMLAFELYDKHQKHFEKKLKMIQTDVCFNHSGSIRDFSFVTPEILYEKFFPLNSVHRVETTVTNQPTSIIYTLSEKLRKIVTESNLLSKQEDIVSRIDAQDSPIEKFQVGYDLVDLWRMLGVKSVDDKRHRGDIVEHMGITVSELTMLNLYELNASLGVLTEIINLLRAFCNLEELHLSFTNMSNPVLVYTIWGTFNIENEISDPGYYFEIYGEYKDPSRWEEICLRAKVYQEIMLLMNCDTTLSQHTKDAIENCLSTLSVPTIPNSPFWQMNSIKKLKERIIKLKEKIEDQQLNFFDTCLEVLEEHLETKQNNMIEKVGISRLRF